MKARKDLELLRSERDELQGKLLANTCPKCAGASKAAGPAHRARAAPKLPMLGKRSALP